MRNLWKKLKEKDYVITLSNHKAAQHFCFVMMVINVIFYFWLTPKWVSGKAQYGPSPQFVPNVLTIAMFLCAAVVFITETRVIKKQKKTEQGAKEQSKQVQESEETDFFEQLLEESKSDFVTIDLRGLLYIAAALASAVFYVLCADYLGFILTIAIIMVCLLLLYGVRKPLVIMITTLIMSVGVYLAFTKLLALVLPAGKLLKLF